MVNDKYWGVYCPQCDVWLQRRGGELVFYPHPEIANAEIRNAAKQETGRTHLWQVAEFGKQQPVAVDELSTVVELCPFQRNGPGDTSKRFRLWHPIGVQVLD